MYMLKLRVKIPLLVLIGLLLAGLVCAPAFAGKIEGVSVDVANHQGRYVGDNLVDGDPKTAWVGGGKSTGPGKWIELEFPAPVQLESLRVANGNQGKGQFGKYRRMTRGVILYPDQTRQKFVLKPSAGSQAIKLQPKVARSIKIIVTGVAPNSRDKSMGKAKVAVSEITVFGEMGELEIVVTEEGETGAGKQSDEASATKEPAKEVKKLADELKAESVKKKQKKVVAPKLEPKGKAKPEPKPAPAKVAVAKPVEKNAASKKVEPKKQAAKPAPKKAKKKTRKTTPKKKPKKASSASKARMTHLRTAVSVPADKPLEVGVISPWIDLELVAQIKRYFGLLTTLHDSYPDVFVASIQERERATFIVLQDKMRAEKEFGRHHIAMLEHIGLFFDKPTVNGDSATVRVHGPYRYYIENEAFEFQVDTLFSLVKEKGKWMIKDVQDK